MSYGAVEKNVFPSGQLGIEVGANLRRLDTCRFKAEPLFN